MRIRTLIMTVALAVLVSSCRDRQTTTSSSAPTVLFVCERGVGLSAIAAAHFDQLAHEARLQYRAQFRGIEEVATTLPVAIQSGLSADGFDTGLMAPATVSERELEQAEHIIVLDAWLPNGERYASKVTYWNDIPSAVDDFDATRNDIRGRVARLVRLLDPPSH